MAYDVIVADCPWSYRSKRTGGNMKSGAVQKYDTLDTDTLKHVPVVHAFAKDAVLGLWATVPMLEDALDVMKAWGFKRRTIVHWHKTGRLGTGYWFRGQMEYLLIGTRGKVPAFRSSRENVISHKLLAHSAKPEVFQDLLEVECDKRGLTSRLELFARRHRPGWRCEGIELTGHDHRTELGMIESPDGRTSTGPEITGPTGDQDEEGHPSSRAGGAVGTGAVDCAGQCSPQGWASTRTEEQPVSGDECQCGSC